MGNGSAETQPPADGSGVLVERSNGIATIMLSQSDKRNAMDRQMWVALRDALIDTAVPWRPTCPSVRVSFIIVVLTGSPDHVGTLSGGHLGAAFKPL